MASLPRSVAQLATLVGLDGVRLVEEAGLSLAVLDDPDGRVTIEGYERLYARVADVPGMWEGMRLVLAIDSLAPLGVLGYVLSSSATVTEAFGAYQRHATVIGEAFEFDVRPSDTAFVLTFRVPHSLQRLALFNVGTMALNTAVVRVLTGVNVLPTLVELPRPRSEHVLDPAVLVPTEYRYGTEDTVLWFPPEVASMPVRSCDPALFYFVERHANELKKNLAHPETWTARTRRALLERLRGEAPSVDVVARALGTSARTLARRLEEEDRTFKEVLEETRRDLAVSYLRDRNVPLAEVAFLLGYADIPTFHKAFRRWTGRTPGEVRRGEVAA
jgi:AraC-like DNA-binding protein